MRQPRARAASAAARAAFYKGRAPEQASPTGRAWRWHEGRHAREKKHRVPGPVPCLVPGRVPCCVPGRVPCPVPGFVPGRAPPKKSRFSRGSRRFSCRGRRRRVARFLDVFSAQEIAIFRVAFLDQKSHVFLLVFRSKTTSLFVPEKQSAPHKSS